MDDKIWICRGYESNDKGLARALRKAKDGDVIVMPAGKFKWPVKFKWPIKIKSGVTIMGAEGFKTVFDATDAFVYGPDVPQVTGVRIEFTKEVK